MRATKKWTASYDCRGTESKRGLATESNQIGPNYKKSEAVASQHQRLKYLGHTVATPTRNIPDSSIAYNRGVKTSYGQNKKYCDQNSNSRLNDMHKDKDYNMDQLLA